ncbi:hypothetical protein Pint_35425 [Pistacia integerrima]|uniref:Uncharacterized protein n=1 Tax=Pistacia integerrima TaxID=434235 RepID=A0ACC0XZD6_9ROSI|nr:hypothetical protein Pint_35425 [Pistacia integerrima]
MGKHTHKKRTCISLFNSHPRCLWGIMLNVLEFQDWSYVKKRLPHWKHGGNKQARGDGNPVNNKASAADKLQATSNAKVNNSNAEKAKQAAPEDKNCVKAGIKSQLGEKVSKTKDQLHRSSTYPIKPQLTRTLSFHRLDTLQEDFLAEIISDDESAGIINETNGDSHATGLKGPLSKSLRELIAKETYEDHQLMLAQNDLGHNQIDETSETQLKENHMPPRDDSKEALLEINTKELATDASLYWSEDFLNSLDIIKLNKEFFIKLMHDPSSPLAKPFHSQQKLRARTGLTKSKTFPLHSLSGQRSYGPRNLKQKKNVIESHEIGGKRQVAGQVQNSIERGSEEDVYNHSMQPTVIEYRADGIQKVDNEMDETGSSSSLASSQHLKSSVRNQAAVKLFKHLKQKIKHAIKESKKERDRIALDAVLHKIPCDQGFSRDLKMENFDQFKDSFIKSDGKDSPTSSNESVRTTLSSKSGLHHAKRASLSETLNTFTQLYEPNFNREAKQCVSGGLKLRREETTLLSRSTPKSLTRIFSLPELKSYFCQGEDPVDASPWMLVRVPLEETASISSFGEQNNADMLVASEHSSQLDNLVEGQIQENLTKVTETDPVIGDQVGSNSVACISANAEVGRLVDDLNNLMSKDSTSNDDQDIEPVATKVAEPSPLPVLDLKFQEVADSTVDFFISEESEVKLGYLLSGEQDSFTGHQDDSSMYTHTVALSSDFEKPNIPSNHVHIDIPLVQVDVKDKAKFDYVKNVLKLSGFSGNESLGIWHCDYQPVGPSVYDEIEGCIPLDLDCSGNEDGSCNQMHLFDMINEILIEIYERSYSYYPKRLSSLCHIHPMPAGHNVLKEVWTNINSYLSLRLELDHSLNYIAGEDLSKNDRWMDLQFDSECVGLELEDLILEELIEETIFS